jgi:predicted ATPase
MRGDNPQALELLNQCRALAERSEDEGLILATYYALTSISFFMGEFTAAVGYGARVAELYDPRQHHILTYLIVGHDPGAQAQEAAGQSLWMLGYPDQARERLRGAVALAEQLEHPYTLTLANITDSVVASLCRDWPTARERAERALGISQEHGFPIGEALARSELGLALARHGQLERGLAQLERSLLAWRAGEMLGLRSQLLARLVEALLVAGRRRAGLDTVEEVLELVATSQECLWEAELHRLKGELLSLETGTGGEAEIERAYRQAIEVARRQSAKSWELRATMSLARLWGRQGRRAEARDTLAEIYGWFTEGFDTGDLMEAAALLEELSGT